jgi:hypothetical protein
MLPTKAQLKIHIEKAKKRGMELFDQGRYAECTGLFSFLCKLEPENHMLQNRLILSRQMAQEQVVCREVLMEKTVPRLSGEAAFDKSVSPVTRPQKEEHTTPITPASRDFSSTPLVSESAKRGSGERSQRVAVELTEPNAIDVRSPRQTEQGRLKITAGQSSSATVRSRRKNQLALILVAIAVLLPAILDHWTTYSHSNRPKGEPVAQRSVQLSNGKQSLAGSELGGMLFIDEGVPADTNRKSNFNRRNDPRIVGGLKVKEDLGDPGVLREGSSSEGVNPDESTFKNKIRTHQTRLTGMSEGMVGKPPGGRNAATGHLKPGFVYPVIHDHLLGSCRGKLELTSSSITFTPTKGTKHRFSFKLSDITGTEWGDRLKVRLTNRTYLFKSALAKTKEDNRAKLNTIYLQLVRLNAQAQ